MMIHDCAEIVFWLFIFGGFFGLGFAAGHLRGEKKARKPALK